MKIDYFSIHRSEQFWNDRDEFIDVGEFIRSFGGRLIIGDNAHMDPLIEISEEDFLILKLRYGYNNDTRS
jgi:hypothetical protein